MPSQFIRYGNFSPTNITNAIHISFQPDYGHSDLVAVNNIRFDYGNKQVATWQRKIEKCFENVGNSQGYKLVITDLTNIEGNVISKEVKDYTNTEEVLNKIAEEKAKEMQMLFKAIEDTYSTAIPFIKQ